MKPAQSDFGPAEPYDAAYVSASLAEAAETMKSMPFPRNGRPAQVRSNMPEYLQDFWELMNSMEDDERVKWQRDQNRTRLMPSPAAIDRMDCVLGWLYGIPDARTRKAVWAYALGFGYRRIARIDGRSHETIRSVVRSGHDHILKCILAFENS